MKSVIIPSSSSFISQIVFGKVSHNLKDYNEIPLQTLLGVWQGLGTQSSHSTPDGVRVKTRIKEHEMINVMLVRLPL